MARKSCVLIICDGWGYRNEAAGNAIAAEQITIYTTWEQVTLPCSYNGISCIHTYRNITRSAYFAQTS